MKWNFYYKKGYRTFRPPFRTSSGFYNFLWHSEKKGHLFNYIIILFFRYESFVVVVAGLSFRGSYLLQLSPVCRQPCWTKNQTKSISDWAASIKRRRACCMSIDDGHQQRGRQDCLQNRLTAIQHWRQSCVEAANLHLIQHAELPLDYPNPPLQTAPHKHVQRFVLQYSRSWMPPTAPHYLIWFQKKWVNVNKRTLAIKSTLKNSRSTEDDT